MNKFFSSWFLVLILFILIYLYQYNPNSSDNFFISCPTKQLSKLDCPLCGGQRYLHYVLNLEFKPAFQANAFLFFTFPVFLYYFIAFLLKPFAITLPTFHITNKMVLFIILTAILFTIGRNYSLILTLF
ncbi:MAG: DUF2752 domain-containing protein [Flavobacteriales bacterium]